MPYDYCTECGETYEARVCACNRDEVQDDEIVWLHARIKELERDCDEMRVAAKEACRKLDAALARVKVYTEEYGKSRLQIISEKKVALEEVARLRAIIDDLGGR